MAEWRNGLRSALVDRYGFAADNVRVLVDETVKTGEQATAQNVRTTIAAVRKQLTADDVLLIVLLGHGTFDGDVAKFNLVGPDLTAAEWSTLLDGPSRPHGHRQHDRSEFSFPAAPLRRQSHRHHRDRFRGAEIRHGFSRVFRQGDG